MLLFADVLPFITGYGNRQTEQSKSLFHPDGSVTPYESANDEVRSDVRTDRYSEANTHFFPHCDVLL
jgi:hypothetical protein